MVVLIVVVVVLLLVVVVVVVGGLQASWRPFMGAQPGLREIQLNHVNVDVNFVARLSLNRRPAGQMTGRLADWQTYIKTDKRWLFSEADEQIFPSIEFSRLGR